MKIPIRPLLKIDVNGDRCGKCEGIKAIYPNPMSRDFVCRFNSDVKIGINRDNLERCQACLNAEKDFENELNELNTRIK